MKDNTTWHELKTWPEYFQAIMDGSKMFEIRNNDRGFKQGDYLILKEWDPIKTMYTGAIISKKIGFILEGKMAENFGLKPGYCIMSLLNI